ncbi:MAG: DEAD/DEAH box helicase [Anaerolineae bacterium]|nr:DEAD/DEAH box helicase [Anaerolineae bacterium]
MHILHGTWLSDLARFVLWGEDTTLEPSYRKGRRGRTAPHPFELSTEHGLRYLDQFTTESAPDGAPLVILLPGADKKVQPSPEAQAAGWLPLDGDLELLAWEINTITLSPTDALDFLIQLPLPGKRQAGFTLGSDLAFWQQAALLVMNCLIEQRYVPALKQQGSRYLACWQPVPDADLLAQLATQMPPLCRAMVDSTADALPPHALLHDFLAKALDAFIRETCDGPQGTASPAFRSLRKLLSRSPWLKALTGHNPVLSGSREEQSRLFAAWQRWQEGLEGAGFGAFRVCFRLDEPADDGDRWPLHYLLQAADDPSLLVEAKTVWSSSGSTLNYLEHRFEQPQEKMLAALGLASRLFAPVERSLRQTSPVGVQLDRDEAYTFLVEAVPLLEASHFGVLVPNWWAKRTARLKAKARLKGQAEEPTGFLAREALIGYQWELSLGGERVSRAEFEELVALKQPLVRFRGEWVALNPDQIEAALKFFDAQETEGEMGVLDALKLTAGAEGIAAPEGLELDDMAVEGWLHDFLERVRQPDSSAALAVPESLRATLRPYQQRGFGWLTQMRHMGLGACLADDMGLGKTIQTITFWLHERAVLGVDRPALLVCPTSVVGNWRHELSRFAPLLRVITHHGAQRLQGEGFVKAALGADVVLTSYALLHRDRDTLEQVQWSSVTLDEAQNIKNPATKQAQAARALPADMRLALTGTPVENRLSELWSISQFLNPGYLGSREAFRHRFSLPIERYGDQQAAATLRQLTTPFILRRLKTDPTIIDDLPEKFENKVYCSLTPEQATLYEATVREELEAVEQAEDDMARRGSVLRMLTRLKQICNHPAQFLKEGASSVAVLQDRSGKLARLTEMLEEVFASGDRALIFTQYAEMGEHLQAYLREVFVDEVLFLHGGTPAKKRQEMIRQFQAERGPTVFVLSLKAGGTGLNLTRANHVFHYDRWYNPAVENQATDRAFRIGQTKNVQVHKFMCLGTLEERIDELIEHKQALAESIISEGESWLSEMNTAELRDLVALRRDVMEIET